MRIIQGKFKGFQFPTYLGNNTRPSTDLLKESLFNTLEQAIDLENKAVLDLFAGTGNVGLECLSRGANQLLSVDNNPANCKYMAAIEKKLQVANWEIKRRDAIQFIKKNEFSFDFIFADPPYDYPHIHELVNHVIVSPWFNAKPSIFIIEHVDRLVFKQNTVFLNKQYGNTAITGFRSNAVE